MPSFTRLFALPALAIGLALAAPAPLRAAEPAYATSVSAETLSEKKQIASGLYLTAAEAAAVLSENPNVALIDVRTPSETMLIGYAPQAAVNIPSKFIDPAYVFDAEKGVYKMIDNPEFVDEIRAWLDSDAAAGVDTLLVMCRSGSRSAAAIKRLTEAEAKAEAAVDVTLYNVVDGFEGDKTEAGERTVNGWRNAGLPWTYKIREGLWPGHN